MKMTHSDTGGIKGNGKLVATLANTLLLALYETKRSAHSNLIRKLYVLLCGSHYVWQNCDFLCTNTFTHSKMIGMCAILPRDIFRHARVQTGRIKFLSIKTKNCCWHDFAKCSGILPLWAKPGLR